MYEKYERLKNKAGKTDYRVSIDTGVSRSILSEWKTGKHTPSLQNIRKIAEYFGVAIEDLL